MGATQQAFEYFVQTGRVDYQPEMENSMDETPDLELVAGISLATNLTPSTVAELLSKGWRYVEKLGHISRWEHPMWRLEGEAVPLSIPSKAKIDPFILPEKKYPLEKKYLPEKYENFPDEKKY